MPESVVLLHGFSGTHRAWDGVVAPVSYTHLDVYKRQGQDLSIGYDHHDADTVQLYLEESFSFRVATPEAAVALRA